MMQRTKICALVFEIVVYIVLIALIIFLAYWVCLSVHWVFLGVCWIWQILQGIPQCIINALRDGIVQTVILVRNILHGSVYHLKGILYLMLRYNRSVGIMHNGEYLASVGTIETIQFDIQLFTQSATR